MRLLQRRLEMPKMLRPIQQCVANKRNPRPFPSFNGSAVRTGSVASGRGADFSKIAYRANSGSFTGGFFPV